MGAKVLKVAVTQGKQILEQKLITERVSVSVGSKSSNQLVVKGEGVPESFTLFEVVNGKYCLNFTEEMTGKVNVGGGQLDFETARRQTGVRKADNSYQMALSESAKGAVNLGKDGVRLIFQFVDAPAAVEPTKMPESTYMPPLQRLDRLFWTLLIISAVLHTIGVIAALNAPPPPKVPITKLPDRFAKLIIKKKPVVKPVKEKPKKPVKDGEGKAKPKEDSADKKPKADKKPAKKPQTSSQKAARREQARQAVKQSAVFKALSIATSGEGGTGVVFQADGDPRTDVSAALAASGGAGVGVADGSPGGPAVRGGAAGGGGPVGIGEVGGVAVGGGGGKIAKRQGPKIRVRMKMSKPKIDDGELDGKSVARKIRARRRAFQACYERELKRNPSLKGKLVLEVTVGENGRVADIFVADNALNNAVANCIKGKMRSIRFPKPEGGEATFSYPFIFASSG